MILEHPMSLISKTVAELKHLLAPLHHHIDPDVHEIVAAATAKLGELEAQGKDLAHEAEGDAKTLTKDAETAAEPVEREGVKTAAVLAAEAAADAHKDA